MIKKRYRAERVILVFSLICITTTCGIEVNAKKIPSSLYLDTQHIHSEYLVINHTKTYPEGISPPLLIYLHGAGQRGEDLAILNKRGGPGPVRYYQNNEKSPFLIVAPQCKPGRYWDINSLNAWYDYICKTENFDKRRVYITGVSMGGFGTFNWVAQRPDIFTAAAPLCGGWARKDMNPSKKQINNMASIPFWIFHGELDKVIPSSQSKNLYKMINDEGIEPAKLKIYHNLGHAIWDETYVDNGRLYKWFLTKNDQK